jgi:hypothetical protein
MSEQPWSADSSLALLLHRIYRDIGPRKQRLCSAAFCRRIHRLLPDNLFRRGIAAVEQYADRALKRPALSHAYGEIESATEAAYAGPSLSGSMSKQASRYALLALQWAAHPTKRDFAGIVADCCAAAVASASAALGRQERAARERYHVAYGEERAAQVHLMRDILLDPTRPLPPVAPEWLTWNNGTVRKLAQAIYDERSEPTGTFDRDRFIVLGDALEEAGCGDERILGHCRGEEIHVRGCWLIDLLTAKR